MAGFIYLYRGGEAPKSPAEGQETMQKWMAWMKELGEKGYLRAIGSPLEKTGKLVSGKSKVVSDGPFAETKDGVVGVLRGDADYGEGFVDEGVGAVLHLAGGVALGVDVGDLLELERAFEGQNNCSPDRTLHQKSPLSLAI